MMLMSQTDDHVPGACRWCFMELAQAIIPASRGVTLSPVRNVDDADAVVGGADDDARRQSHFWSFWFAEREPLAR